MAEILQAQCGNRGGRGLDPAFPDHDCLSLIHEAEIPAPSTLEGFRGGGQAPKVAVLEDSSAKKQTRRPPETGRGRSANPASPHLCRFLERGLMLTVSEPTCEPI